VSEFWVWKSDAAARVHFCSILEEIELALLHSDRIQFLYMSRCVIVVSALRFW